MTDAQLARRGRAIARARNANTTDPLLQAITASKWGSQEQYARQRLKIPASSLAGYRSGAYSCPRPIADKILKDFGIPHDYWMSGVVA